MANTKCGNCDWHTHIKSSWPRASSRKTYCELNQTWKDINDTCEKFTEYNYRRTDDQRRNDAKESFKKIEENKKFQWIKWGTIAAIILVILTLILIFK